MARKRFPVAMIEDARVRLSLEEKTELKRAAQIRGVTISQFLRESATRAARELAA